MTRSRTMCDLCPQQPASTLCDVCGDLLCFGCAVPVPVAGGHRAVLCDACHRLHCQGFRILVDAHGQGVKEWPVLIGILALLVAPLALAPELLGIIFLIGSQLLGLIGVLIGLADVRRVARGRAGEDAMVAWLGACVALLALVTSGAARWFGALMDALA